MNHLQDLLIKKLINKTRLKGQLLEHFHEDQEQIDGKNTILVFVNVVRDIFKEDLNFLNLSEDAVNLVKTALIIRKHIFTHCSFSPKCQNNSLPSILKSLISRS